MLENKAFKNYSLKSKKKTKSQDTCLSSLFVFSKAILKQIKLVGAVVTLAFPLSENSHFLMKVLTQLPSPRPFPSVLEAWTGKNLAKNKLTNGPI